ncbi:MAG: hypothetical protein OEY33_00360 [Bdellovibrionales bacterium]|nr:hypothetical protein [Bdellovibrionales bacterium]
MELISVCSRSFSRHPLLRKEILDIYPNVQFNDEGKRLVGDGLIHFLKDSSRAIIGLEILNRETLSKLKKLKVIGKYGVGLNNLDLKALEEFNIKLGHSPGVNRRSVSELVLGFSIDLLRNITKNNKTWNPETGRLLSNCTFGIIGCGNIGSDLANLLKPFGTKILVHDLRKIEGFTQVSLIDLLKNSDIVTLHVPLDESTFNLLSMAEFSLLKKNALLINTSRGGIVNEKDLFSWLNENPLSRAAFDVFEEEPFNDSPLLTLPNFFTTSHIGGGTEESILAMGRAAINGLKIL